MISKIFCFLLILLAILALISIFKEIKNIKNKTKIYIIEVILNIISVLSLLIGSLLYIIVDKFSFNHTSYIVYIIVTLSCLIKLSIKLLCKKNNSKHYILQSILNMLVGILFIFDRGLNIYYNKYHSPLSTIIFFLLIAKIYIYLIFGEDETNNE